MKWLLRSSHSIPDVSDDFRVGRFRLRLGGGTLTVEAEGESNEGLTSAAHDLVTRYAAVLRKHIPELINLVTCEEFASMPPLVITERGTTAAKRKRLSIAVRRAKHELLGVDNPYLRQCYDYIEEALEDETNHFVPLYKFAETLEEALDAEANISEQLKMVKKSIKKLKTLLSHKSRDARHAPKIGEEVRRLSPKDRNRAMSDADEMLAAYERHIGSKTAHK